MPTTTIIILQHLLNSSLVLLWHLFKGGVYSRVAFVSGNTVTSPKTCWHMLYYNIIYIYMYIAPQDIGCLISKIRWICIASLSLKIVVCPTLATQS